MLEKNRFHLLPMNPTEPMYNGIVKAILYWDRMEYNHTWETLTDKIVCMGYTVPDWMTLYIKKRQEECKLPGKGDIAIMIYKAMVDTYYNGNKKINT